MAGRFAQRGMLLGAAFAGVAFPLWAANAQPDTAPASYHVTRYTTEDGLPQNTVRALLQTRDGYVWAGTLAGLARFDGVRFHVFNASNTPEMPHDAINALAEDRQDGSLWISTGSGLLRFHRHRFERFGEQQGYPQPFGGLWPARGEGLWYSPTYGRLVLLQNGAARSWQLRPERVPGGSVEILGHRIHQVEDEEDGSVLVLMRRGLLHFVPATGAISELQRSPSAGDDYRYFYKQTNGTVFVKAREGLWRWSAGEWELIEPIPRGDPQCPTRVFPARNGDLWIPWSDEGPPRLARFRAGRSEYLDLANLPDYPMNESIEDREGHLWLATESGLCQLRENAVRVYAREQGLRNDDVKSVAEGPDGTIWLGTAQGLSGIKDGQVTNLPPVEPSNWGRGQVLLADRRGRVWCRVQPNTVAAFDHGSWGSRAILNLESGLVRTLYEARSGRIWAGFERGAGWIDEEGTFRGFPHALANPDVRVIHEDCRGDLWFGTYGGGLNRLHDGQITSYTTTLGEYNNRAWWIHEDAVGVFWVGSQDGLNRFVPPGVEFVVPASAGQGATLRVPSSTGESQPARAGTTNAGRFFTFTTRHGLHENTINNVQEDDFGCLWLSGLRGIYRVARQELNDVAADRQVRAKVLAYGEADGMLNSECNGGDNQPSGCKDRAGRIWFPTARGVAMIDPRTIRRNDVPPPVVIEQVRADEEIVYGDGVARLNRSTVESLNRESRQGRAVSTIQPVSGSTMLAPGRARVLEIRYTANSFAAPHRMRFKYRLEGHDRDWRFAEANERTVFYTNLRPGAYTFRVTACNNHGVWSETSAEFAFTLAPHFWQTWLFYVLATAAVLGLGGAVQTYRLRWQRRLLQAEQRQALADERTRIARDLHDDLGTALTGLALQVDVLRRTAHDGPALGERLADSAARIRALAQHMREVVWTVNPRCDTVSSFASFLEQQAGQFHKADGLRCRLELPEDIPALPLDGQTRHELALAVREAIANVVRHAAASEIVLSLEVTPDQLLVRIADNGRGFRAAEGQSSGQGLANMHARMERIGGRCEWRSTPGAGTTIELHVPLKAARPRADGGADL